MDLKYLRTFLTVAETGSFVSAAKKLNYTQSTITFQMGQLEQELAVPLFEKNGRTMALTAAGRNLIPDVERIFQDVERLRCSGQDLADCRGDLRIGAAETMLCYRLPPILKRFVEQAPGVRLFLQSMNCYDIRDALIRGTLDLGVFYADVGGLGSRLLTCTLGRFPLALTASADTREAFPDFITPGRTIPVPLLINEPRCIFRQIFEQYLGDRDIQLDHTIELGSIHTIKNLVKNNVGITFLPQFAIQEELERRELVEIPTDLQGRCITAICARRKDTWCSPAADLFFRLCREAAAEQDTEHPAV